MKNSILHFIRAALVVMVLCGCEHVVNSTRTQPHGTLQQLSGCRSGEWRAATSDDSCFAYQFAETLRVDFCLSGNCCPDQNRFKLAYEISADTIYVAVADTAAQLCRCVCTYVLRAEFAGLPRDHYVFCCVRNDYSGRLIHYIAHVYRRPES